MDKLGNAFSVVLLFLFLTRELGPFPAREGLLRPFCQGARPRNKVCRAQTVHSTEKGIEMEWAKVDHRREIRLPTIYV